MDQVRFGRGRLVNSLILARNNIFDRSEVHENIIFQNLFVDEKRSDKREVENLNQTKLHVSEFLDLYYF